MGIIVPAPSFDRCSIRRRLFLSPIYFIWGFRSSGTIWTGWIHAGILEPFITVNTRQSIILKNVHHAMLSTQRTRRISTQSDLLPYQPCLSGFVIIFSVFHSSSNCRFYNSALILEYSFKYRRSLLSASLKLKIPSTAKE